MIARSPTDSLPILRTPRLMLYVPGPEAAEACACFYRENADFLAPWEPRRGARSFDVALLRAARERAIADAIGGHAYSFAITADRVIDADTTIIGWLNFTNIVHGVFQSTTMGYKLAEHAQHRGYMTEAARAGIAFSFGTLRLHRIMANYQEHNHRSKALLSRLGFQTEGYAKAYLFIDGDWRDHVLTALVNPESVFPES